MGFKANYKVSGYSHDVHTTIAPVDMSYSSQSSQLGKTYGYFSPQSIACIAPFSTKKNLSLGMELLYILTVPITAPDFCGAGLRSYHVG